jgi:hypothetical protein
MDSIRVVHRPNPVISPEQARNARARAWAFVFDCWQKKVVETNTSKDDSTYLHQRKEVSVT